MMNEYEDAKQEAVDDDKADEISIPKWAEVEPFTQH